MEPNYQMPQPQPTPGPGLEYLDSIAAQPQTKTLNPFVLWGLITATVIAVVLIGIGIFSGGNTPTKQLTRVGASTANLQDLAEDANRDIKSGELRSLNSSLIITLTNTNRDLADPLKKQDINVNNAKKDKTVAAVAAGYAQIEERLEDARLNDVYDRTYAREMVFLLKTLHADMEELFNSSRSKSLKTALETSDNNLAPLLESFESLQTD